MSFEHARINTNKAVICPICHHHAVEKTARRSATGGVYTRCGCDRCGHEWDRPLFLSDPLPHGHFSAPASRPRDDHATSPMPGDLVVHAVPNDLAFSVGRFEDASTTGRKYSHIATYTHRHIAEEAALQLCPGRPVWSANPDGTYRRLA